ncbi:prepilin peptidase [Roseateles sp. BYS180W]|uniref:Prepilin leader peptidase/N-methyltransferase n=1 Tax=Roseateles rivi TaxID=3299028 RepID=A0ABW7FRF7_9BURK
MVAELDFWLSPWVLGLLGLCIGSFLNVVIHRLPRMMERQWLHDCAAQLQDDASLQNTGLSPAACAALKTQAEQLQTALEGQPRLGLAMPPSRCPQCQHQLPWYQNIPVLSWLQLRGKCASCRTPIGMRYPLVELLTGALFAALAVLMGPKPELLLWCGFVTALVALAGIDWDTTLLPDDITLPLLWAGLLAAWAGWTLPLSEALLGAVVGYLSLWTVFWLFKLLTGKEGMGYGDFKLLAALGAWLGWQMILPIVLMASIIGAVVGLVMKLRSSLREGRYVPFGPFLAGGGLVVLLAGNQRVLGWLGWA